MNMNKSVLLIGAGPMAVEYAKVLKNQNVPFATIGRGEKSAAAFTAATGATVQRGSVIDYLKGASPTHAIVAVSEENLATMTLALLQNGVKDILVEKPAGLHEHQIRELNTMAKSKGAKVSVGYNRRFYASVLKAQEMIKADGGVKSFEFEFSEWSHVIEQKICPIEVKHHWFLQNSSHVVDLAFHLGGTPTQLSALTGGSLSWHPPGAIFVGSGATDKGALFSYSANWTSPGRWRLEVLTAQRRYIFKPLEQLQTQELRTVKVEPVAIDDRLDKEFKPGLYRQVEAYLSSDNSILPSLEAHTARLDWLTAIRDGKT
jgi:predicted dehydrogenase